MDMGRRKDRDGEEMEAPGRSGTDINKEGKCGEKFSKNLIG